MYTQRFDQPETHDLSSGRRTKVRKVKKPERKTKLVCQRGKLETTVQDHCFPRGMSILTKLTDTGWLAMQF
jgi:hypothetical protein